MDIIVTLIVGGIIGWLASVMMKTNAQMGLIWPTCSWASWAPPSEGGSSPSSVSSPTARSGD